MHLFLLIYNVKYTLHKEPGSARNYQFPALGLGKVFLTFHAHSAILAMSSLYSMGEKILNYVNQLRSQAGSTQEPLLQQARTQ